jgi:hypothetical protein
MLFDSPYFRAYLYSALEETPRIFRYVLGDMTEEQADARLDPDRFTLREAVAHLADWETVLLYRMRRIAEEELPVLPDIDEWDRGIEKRYSGTDWREQLDTLESRRTEMVAFLHEIPAEAWARRGIRPEIGEITLMDIVQLIPIHDVYHIKQAREYLRVPSS